LAAQFSLKAGSTRKFLYHPQLVELADLARAFPQTRIILNHVGGPLGIGRMRTEDPMGVRIATGALAE